MTSLSDIQLLLRKQNKKESSPICFFKTAPGQYGAHDRFLGLSVPFLRFVAHSYAYLSFEELSTLLASPFNEERLLALFILIIQYKKKYITLQAAYDFYNAHLDAVNNWNLVDSSAPYIMGPYLWNRDKAILFTYAHSESIWKKRIAIVTTWHFIKQEDVQWTMEIAHLLLSDTHDLIHKAVGWMLREAGKKNLAMLIEFLETHAHRMPHTMLRYAVEKMDATLRKHFMGLKKIK